MSSLVLRPLPLETYLNIVAKYNLSHLVQDPANLSHVTRVLEDNWHWPPDMRRDTAPSLQRHDINPPYHITMMTC